MGTFGFSGLKTQLGTALAVMLTSLLAWVFASSAASVERLGETVETTLVANHPVSINVPNARA
jgi:hypothetical protein